MARGDTDFQHPVHRARDWNVRHHVFAHAPWSIPEPENVPTPPGGRSGTSPCCDRPRSDSFSPATARKIPESSLGHHAHRNLSAERRRKEETSRRGTASPEPHEIEATSPR